MVATFEVLWPRKNEVFAFVESTFYVEMKLMLNSERPKLFH